MSRVLNFKDIKSALNEAFDEGLKKNMMVKGNAPAAAPAAQAQPSMSSGPLNVGQGIAVGNKDLDATDKNITVNSDKLWKPIPEYAMYVNDPEYHSRKFPGQYLEVAIGGVPNNHQNKLIKYCQENANFPLVVTRQNIDGIDKKGNPLNALLIFLVPSQDRTNIINFFQVVKGMGDYMVNKLAGVDNIKGYDKSICEKLPTMIKNVIQSAPTEDELKNKDMIIESSWKNLVSKLTDPATIAQLRKMGGVYYNATDFKNHGELPPAHVLSPRNKLLILMQNPNATYVLQKWVWESYANRTVNDGAKPIIITFPFRAGSIPLTVKNNAAQQCGFRDYSHYKSVVKAGKISVWESHAFDILCEYMAPKYLKFYSVKVYDIADTTLMAGAKDVWNDDVNYSDNMLGTPNQAAIDANAQWANDTGTELQQGGTDNTDADLYYLYEIMKAILSEQKRGIRFNASDDISDNLAKAVEAYGRNYMALNASLTKDDLVTPCAAVLAKAVMLSLGVDSNYANSLYNSCHNADIQKDIKDVWGAYEELMPRLETQLAKFKARYGTNKAMKQSADGTAPADASQAALKPTGTDGATVNEDAPVANDGVNIDELSFNEFASIANGLGGGNSSVEEPQQSNEIEMDEEPSPENLQESFFRLFDKIDRF